MSLYNISLIRLGRLLSRMLSGVGSFTVEDYTAVNSKRGVQYEASFTTSLAASATTYFTVAVGDQDVIIKDINVQFTSEEITSTLFKNPVNPTGGAEVDVYNFNDRDAIPDDVVITAGVSVSGEGTQVGPEIRSLGTSAGNPSQQLTNLGSGSGVERILAKNTTYLYKVVNTDSNNPAEISSTLTFYQGKIEVKANG